MTLYRRGFSVSTCYHREPWPKTYHVELWYQPFWIWLAGTVYHWYDMRVCKVPGFRKFEEALERYHHWRHPGDGDNWLYLPLSIRQDIRCSQWARKKRVVVAKFEVDSETYERLKSRPV